MRKHKIKTSLYFFLASLFLFGATFFAIIITQGGSVTDQGVSTNTGVLRLSVYPENIEFKLYIDSLLINNIVNRGTNVEAGLHDIRIEAESMSPWEKKVNITKGIVTDLKAKLYPTNLKMEQITNSNVLKLLFSESAEYIFYIINDSEITTENGIWRMQTNNNNLFFFNNPNETIKFAELTDDINILLSDFELLLQPSPDNEKLLISSPLNNEILILNNLANNVSVKSIDITKDIGYYPESISWLNDSISLLIENPNAIYEYDLTNKRSTLIKYDPSGDVVNDHNQQQLIWYDKVKQSLNIYKNQTNLELEFPLNTIFINVTNINIPRSDSRFALLTSDNRYLILDLEELEVIDTALTTDLFDFIDLSSDGLSYLFKDNNDKLLTFTIEVNLALDELITKTNEFNETIKASDKVIFTSNSSNILIFDSIENSISSFESDGTNMINLITEKGLSRIFNFDSRSESLYIFIEEEIETGDVQANIYKIGLVLTD